MFTKILCTKYLFVLSNLIWTYHKSYCCFVYIILCMCLFVCVCISIGVLFSCKNFFIKFGLNESLLLGLLKIEVTFDWIRFDYKCFEGINKKNSVVQRENSHSSGKKGLHNWQLEISSFFIGALRDNRFIQLMFVVHIFFFTIQKLYFIYKYSFQYWECAHVLWCRLHSVHCWFHFFVFVSFNLLNKF